MMKQLDVFGTGFITTNRTPILAESDCELYELSYVYNFETTEGSAIYNATSKLTELKEHNLSYSENFAKVRDLLSDMVGIDGGKSCVCSFFVTKDANVEPLYYCAAMLYKLYTTKDAEIRETILHEIEAYLEKEQNGN